MAKSADLRLDWNTLDEHLRGLAERYPFILSCEINVSPGIQETWPDPGGWRHRERDGTVRLNLSLTAAEPLPPHSARAPEATAFDEYYFGDEDEADIGVWD